MTEPSVCLIYAMLRLHVNGQTSAAAKFTTQTLFDLERKEAADEIFQIAGLHLEEAHSGAMRWVLRNRFRGYL